MKHKHFTQAFTLVTNYVPLFDNFNASGNCQSQLILDADTDGSTNH